MNYKKIRTEKSIELRYNVVMEENLGRLLKSGEMVHHIDQVKRIIELCFWFFIFKKK